jgi:multiple sugar transport system substrate-binding protein
MPDFRSTMPGFRSIPPSDPPARSSRFTGSSSLKRSTRLTVAVATAAATVGLAACGSSGSGAKTAASAASPSGTASSSGSTGAFTSVPAGTDVSITLASYLPLLGPAGIDELSSLVSGFERLHPNIHVITQPETSSSAIAGMIQQDEVSGQTPDVAQDSFNDLKFLTQKLGAADLDSVVGAAGVAANFGGTYPYAAAVTKLGEVDGQVYGIPWTLSTPILFYNANLFTKAGLDPSSPPTTWSQVQTDAVKIKAATGAAGLVNGCIGAAASGSDWCLQAILDSDGGGVMNASQTALTFNQSANVAALGTIQGLAKSGAMANLSSAQMTAAFAAGKLSMILDTSALASSLVKADGGHFPLKATPLVGFGTRASVPTNSGSALFILSKQRVKQEADWELITYLTSPASETTITENVGYPPLRTTIADQAMYLKSYLASDQFLAPNLAQLRRLTPWVSYPGPNYSAITTLLTNAAANIVFEGQDPTKALGSAQSQASRLLS